LGGATAGRRFCEDVSAGTTSVPFHEWRLAGFTFDGHFARSYFNGLAVYDRALNPEEMKALAESTLPVVERE
jgi:hypothetical protein